MKQNILKLGVISLLFLGCAQTVEHNNSVQNKSPGTRSVASENPDQNDCPQGYEFVPESSTRFAGAVPAYCISKESKAEMNYYKAEDVCAEEAPGGRICKVREWSKACTSTDLGANMTGKWHWVDDDFVPTTGVGQLRGQKTCLSYEYKHPKKTKASFHCCVGFEE